MPSSSNSCATTWMTVELGHTFEHVFEVTADPLASGSVSSSSLVTAGKDTVAVSATPTTNPHLLRLTLGLYGQGKPIYNNATLVVPGSPQQVVVITDQAKHLVEVTVDGRGRLSTTLLPGEPVQVKDDVSSVQHASPALTVVNGTASLAKPVLCRSLIH